MAQNGGAAAGKLTLLPNLDAESTRAHNLTVLQRIDPSVEDILFTAAHVTLYDFNIDLNQWSRKDVEGSLFVVKRNAQPRFQFIVMNRRNAANLVENILGDFEYELQVPYLLYRNASQEVNGIWFYNSSECEAVANLFNRIIGAFSKVPTKPKGSLSKSSMPSKLVNPTLIWNLWIKWMEVARALGNTAVQAAESCFIIQQNRLEFDGSEVVSSVTMAEGPIEPSTPLIMPISSVPDHSSAAFHNDAGSNPMASMQQQQYLTSGLLPLQGQPLESARVPALQTSAPSTVSTPAVASLSPESKTSANGNHTANLIKPSLFASSNSSTLSMVAPFQSSSVPPASTFQPSFTLQQPSATTSLHPFPPPVSASATPASNYGSIITRDKVREALSRLAQNDQFVDMVYREILNAQYP